MARPEDLLEYLKADMGFLLETYVPERYLVPNTSFTSYNSRESSWYSRPPAIIRKNGAILTAGYTVDYTNGIVTFSPALTASDVVTAEFYFSPISDSALIMALNAGTRELASLIGVAISPAADVNALYEIPIVDLAYRRLYRPLMAATADYHKWDADGVSYDKNQVFKNYAVTIEEKSKAINQAIARLRLTGLIGGINVEVLDTAGQ